MDSYIKSLEDAILQYVGFPVLEHLKKDPENALKLSRQNIVATIFFTDIRSFTNYINPEKMIDDLNIYYELMSEIIIRNNGFVVSLIGDTIFAIFGISKKQHANDACKAAVECIKSLEKLNRECDIQTKIKVGIGINSGIVTLGNVGSKYKLKYTVVGDIVNMASRMENLTRQYERDIILTEGTKRLLTLNYNIKELDKIPIRKGSEEKLSIYTLII